VSGKGAGTRSIDLSIAVDAAPDAVWAAISDSELMSR